LDQDYSGIQIATRYLLACKEKPKNITKKKENRNKDKVEE